VFIPLLLAALGTSRDDAAVDYIRQVRPILSRHCLACHGRDEANRKAGLRLDTFEGATATLQSGATAIVPGNPDASDLIFRVTEEDPAVRMPPPKGGQPLTPEEVEVLTRWIAEGAKYGEHWAFVPPAKVEAPAVADGGWARNPIDGFIAARRAAAGLTASPEADRATLVRRLSLDLRGLPPTPDEVAGFVGDDRPDAYERLVDRYLADPAYGERWARVWLDLARYADSAGYGSDPLRPNMWRYRDWVIDALNANLPYDRFVVDQIAGDLKPDASLSERMATAFHRNTMTNTEGGTDDEEFRVAAIKDRVDTTGQVFMGLTFGCAKCHSHKYDPISMDEYYSLFAFFNQTADNDQPDESPVIAAPTALQRAERARVESQIAELRKQLEVTTPELAAAQAAWEAELAAPIAWRTLTPAALESEAGATLEVDVDGVIRASGTSPAQDVYTLTAPLPPGALHALRIETIPDAGLPAGGAGRASDGNFVLSRVGVEVEPESAGATPVGRVVRVVLPGADRMLSLAEVQVESGGQNVALGGEAAQSSTAYGGEARRAIDGNTNGHYFDVQSTTHTETQADPWWQVRLPSAVPVDRVTVWNRTDGGLEDRLAGARVELLDDAGAVVWSSDVEVPRPSATLSPSGRRPVKFVRAAADFSQDRFPAESVLRATPSQDTGWAVGPRVAERHELVLLANAPAGRDASSRLIIRLHHKYKDAGFTLGRFRVSVSSDPGASRRAGLPLDVLAIVDTPAGDRTDAQRERLAAHYRSIAPALQPLRERIAALETSLPPEPTLPVMQELPAEKRRVTRLLNKGNFLDPGKEVAPGVPAAFGALPDGAPANRLGLALWLVDARNPLTARVAANRAWAQLFGAGLVETEEDFGTQGELPSHPELLDWLAVALRDGGWDMKGLVRSIVTSATYRQSSRVTAETLAIDPRNRLLARAPRLRLEAELVRDQALALSGLLSRKVGGPSVFPPQPEGLWQAAFNGERTWTTSPGADRHRRGLYTFWRRTVPYPSMAAFDAPSRELCSVKRVRSNTPLQAFVTLNDPVYVEAAQALGRRIVAEGGATPDEQARFGLRLCLAREPDAAQVGALKALYDSEAAHYRGDPDAARALATEPIGPLPDGADPAEMAAWTSVANVLLNLDAVLTRN
jgi:hypothetical protein